ncbi:MAG: DUF4158 domain-containing protein [Actinobacteria bacterium]|nr:DUF4158 domain-containing protein [Actinomycetota bacterium]
MTYTQREKTRLEHQWEIAREVGYPDFVDTEAELAVWVDDRAWTTDKGRRSEATCAGSPSSLMPTPLLLVS